MEKSDFASSINLDDYLSGYDDELCEKNEKEDTSVDDNFRRLFDLSADEIMCREFGSEEQAYEFYSLYAKHNGFVVRKDDITRDTRGNLIMRQFVCNRERLRNKKHFMRVDRKRDHRLLTRTNCQAKLRIHYHEKSLKCKVVSFEQSHNHELTPSRLVHLHPAYHRLSDIDKAQVDTLQTYGLRSCHIMGYLVAQKGSYCRVGFIKKDMYNYLDRKNEAKVKKGDVRAVLSYLQGKDDSDPLLYGKYSTGFDGKLKRLFWADGVSRYDFQGFGDILAFDTTYKMNKSYCKKKSSMVEFFHKFEQAKKEYRNNELMTEFKNMFSEPVLTTYLRSIEKEAAKFYTHEIFREVKEEIEKANALIVTQRLVVEEILRLFECRGIPCSHIITMMRNEDMDTIPRSCYANDG
ncbi:FAR1 DNA-binding domain [Sesbania bispinosa]|nr:FAR1 DNA-binding domain [Sesbania bispinosa]